jgi:hypothetical protein
MSQWLPLTEYSSKYKVSLSTLRRRIKAEDIQFRFADGKYLIIDEPISTTTSSAQPLPQQSPSPSIAQQQHRPSPNLTKLETHDSGLVKHETPAVIQSSIAKTVSKTMMAVKSLQSDDTILSAANKLLAELKKAYSQILQEKEEQILNLKEEVSDLKTLVKVLESDNQRYKNRPYL